VELGPASSCNLVPPESGTPPDGVALVSEARGAGGIADEGDGGAPASALLLPVRAPVPEPMLLLMGDATLMVGNALLCCVLAGGEGLSSVTCGGEPCSVMDGGMKVFSVVTGLLVGC